MITQLSTVADTTVLGKLDDHSRLIAGFRWGLSEDSLHLAEALKRAIAIRGVPARLYVDYADTPVMPIEHPGWCCARDVVVAGSA